MKRYGQFRNIFFTLDEYGDLFSLKEHEDHRRRKTVSPGIVIEIVMEIVKKTVQIFERHEEVVVVSSDNTDILVLLLYPLLELSLPYQQLMLFAHVWSGWDTNLTIFKQGNFS